ncbi:MAG: ABC transporter substrate-binding protein [Sedimentibacter saalensis]|jgi:putative ABC transport system substrate-binding protein|uniref:ABC transporter substrate-binding protein n=1 Tax=Sedimentibacter saalensis TaxID=130788 RepID=UPI002B1F9C22|nr:ABC transporter substrate-binding protein [Sedimentibacter saalensis]MEA5094014.1 ABC transporter substrate-binding protein [Sedimentibacter saalensis]
MKKLMALLISAAMITTLFTGCSTKAESAETKTETNNQAAVTETAKTEKLRVGIVQAVNHPSLDEIREYAIKGLEESDIGENIEIIYKDAQGDPANVNTIISQFVGDEVDMIIPIATGAAQSAAAATKNIPIVFAAVSYPVKAGLVEDMNVTDKNITGVSNAIAIEDIFKLSQKLTPKVKTYGFIYNTSEVNAVASTERAKAYCDENGLKYVEATITNSSDLLQTSQSLMGKVDAIFVPNDNTIASAMPVLSAEAIKAGIPVYTGADSMVIDGGFATVGIDYKVLGRQVGDMAVRILEGQSIADNHVEVINQYSNIINMTTAKALGLELDQETIKDFKIIE